MTDLVLITCSTLALAVVAHGCRRAEHRRKAHFVSMRWDEIARHDRTRTRTHRTVAVVLRSISRTRDALLLATVCFGALALVLVVQS